jgi:hypothetical protein
LGSSAPVKPDNGRAQYLAALVNADQAINLAAHCYGHNIFWLRACLVHYLLDCRNEGSFPVGWMLLRPIGGGIVGIIGGIGTGGNRSRGVKENRFHAL